MKKKLEAELISIAHRILKMKHRDDVEQLQQETLRLYEKLSVLRFVEDNFGEVKPTIGYASAEEKLEEIYGLEEQAPEQPQQKQDTENVEEIKQQQPTAETQQANDAFEENIQKQDQHTESDSGEGVDTTGSNESPASQEEINYTEQKTDEKAQPEENKQEEPKQQAEPEAPKAEEQPKPAAEPVPAQPVKQKEITFEDFHDYKEPEFVRKSDVQSPASINKEFLPKEPEMIMKQEEKAETMWQEPKKEEPKQEQVRDWRDWEPSSSPYASKPAEEPKKEEPAPQANRSGSVKAIALGLNDRIAFEKNLFAGSSDDLNRVISQLNTLNTFREAKAFVNDLVKPDYNNWKGKEEYEERFMAIVERKFE